MSSGIQDLGNERSWAAKVEALAGYGLSAADIACVLAIDEDVLKATYAHELKSSHLKANARVAESLYRKAIGEGRESVTAAIFWLKTRARWKETSVQEHIDVGGSITVSDTAAFIGRILESAERVDTMNSSNDSR